MNRHVLKILCVLTALIIWIQVASSSMLTREVDLPLDLIGLSGDATLAGNTWPSDIRVRATGSKWHFFLHQFLGRELGRVVVDLTDLGPDVFWQRDITVNDVESALVDVSVQPPVRLSLQLDRMVTKRVPVEIGYSGTLPEHRMIFGEVVAEPDSVDVRGPSRLLADFGDAVQAAPLDLGRIRGRQTVMRDLTLDRPDVTITPDKVSVAYDVGQTGADVFPPVASIEIRGPVEELERMPMSAINLTVALTGLGSGTHTVTPEVLLPEHFALVSLEPGQVLVIISVPWSPQDDGPP